MRTMCELGAKHQVDRSRSSSTAVVSTACHRRYDLVTIVWARPRCNLRQAVEDASCARALREFLTTAEHGPH